MVSVHIFFVYALRVIKKKLFQQTYLASLKDVWSSEGLRCSTAAIVTLPVSGGMLLVNVGQKLPADRGRQTNAEYQDKMDTIWH